MEDLDLPEKFACIYVTCGSFMCITGRDNALETLRRCRTHLNPGGVLAFNLYMPTFDYSARTRPSASPFQPKADRRLPNGERLVVDVRTVSEDPVTQMWTEERRYRLFRGETLVAEELRTDRGHWYFPNEIRWMLRCAGFDEPKLTGDYSDAPLDAKHEVIMVVARTPG
jgi:hypothetical protein